MTDNPAPTPPREPLRLPPNGRDVTAEKVGTIIGDRGDDGLRRQQPVRRRIDRPKSTPLAPFERQWPLFQPGEIKMSFSRAVLPIASIFFGLSAAVAQQTAQTANTDLKLPTCHQSMIVGTWQAVFSNVGRGFVCPIGIAANGTLTPGNCILDTGFTLLQPPSGTLTIDRSCHVVGSITYNFNEISAQASVSLWRSIDGSRLSGYQRWTCTNCGDPTSLFAVVPFELIAGQ